MTKLNPQKTQYLHPLHASLAEEVAQVEVFFLVLLKIAGELIFKGKEEGLL